MAGGLGVADQIKPMSRPTLAVSRRREQTIDDFFISVRRNVVDKRFDFFRRRRQADQVEAEPTNQGPAIGLDRGLDPCFFELRQEEAIDVVERPTFVFDLGNGGIGEGLKAPMLRAS